MREAQSGPEKWLKEIENYRQRVQLDQSRGSHQVQLASGGKVMGLEHTVGTGGAVGYLDDEGL